MRKFLASALAALTFGGAVAVTATPAEAQRYYHHGGYYGGGYGGGYYGHRHHGSDTAAVAAVAGIAGLAIGSALSSNSHRGYYSEGYYEPRPYYAERRYYYEPRTCITRDRVWDPYIGRHVTVEHAYDC
ncbi:MAG: hypothetical protein JF588_06265 [Caulobacterales bacterium]|nr:hypothetical protein [Caulobacterales bacterium]